MDVPFLTTEDDGEELTTAQQAREEQKRIAEEALAEKIPQKAAAVILSKFEADLKDAFRSGQTRVVVRVPQSPSYEQRMVSDIVYSKLSRNGYSMSACDGGNLIVSWKKMDVFGWCACTVS